MGIVRYLNSNTSQSDSPFLMDFFPSSTKQLLKKTSGSLVVLLSTAVMSTLKREREREKKVNHSCMQDKKRNSPS